MILQMMEKHLKRTVSMARGFHGALATDVAC